MVPHIDSHPDVNSKLISRWFVRRHGSARLHLASSKYDAKQFARRHKLQTFSSNGPLHDASILWHRGTPSSAVAKSVDAHGTESVHKSDAA